MLENDTDLYNRISGSGYKKGQIINEKNISKIAYMVINSYCSILANIEQNIFKSTGKPFIRALANSLPLKFLFL